MTRNENSNGSMSGWHHYCGWMRGERHCGIFWGIFFIVVGLFWLGKKVNWFSPELITMFWPVVLVIIGIWIIGVALIKKGA